MISGHRDLRMLFRYTHPKPEEVAVKLSTDALRRREAVGQTIRIVMMQLLRKCDYCCAGFADALVRVSIRFR